MHRSAITSFQRIVQPIENMMIIRMLRTELS